MAHTPTIEFADPGRVWTDGAGERSGGAEEGRPGPQGAANRDAGGGAIQHSEER